MHTFKHWRSALLSILAIQRNSVEYLKHTMEDEMKCPTCPDVKLVMSDRQGIEIDYCPDCRGVWLDRGELDKLIEKSASTQAITRHETT